MTKTLYFSILWSLIILQPILGQERKISPKTIQNKILEARKEFLNLETRKSFQLAEEALSEAYEIKSNVLIAKAYNIIGSNFVEFGDTKKAKEYYFKALHYANQSDNDTVRVWVYNNIGAVYSYYENNFEKGIDYYKQGLLYTEKTKDPIQITYNSLNISGSYFDKKRFDQGKIYLEKVSKFLKFHNEIEARINYHYQMALYYSHYNKNKLAEENFLKAINFGKQNNIKLMDSYVVSVYYDFSKFYKNNNDYQKAYQYLELYNTLKEELDAQEDQENIKNQDSKLEVKEYKRKIDIIEKEKIEKEKSLEKTKIIVLLFIIILIILSFFTFYLFKNNKLKKKNYKELQLVNAELQKAKDIAEESMLLKSQFISTITHELRTPLYGVIGITEILSSEHPELVNSKYLKSLQFSANYLLTLVNDILQSSKITEKKIVLEHKKFNLREKLESITNSLQALAIKNNNEILVKIDESIPKKLIGDGLRLSQIFMNLMNNSLKFTENGFVKVQALLEKKTDKKCKIIFSVIDNGIGISKEDHEKVFQEFVQIERRDEDYQGTGLGLPIVKKLVTLFGGEIKLESVENEGTKITFVLDFDYDDNSVSTQENDKFEEDKLDKNLKILLVEDNKINQVVTKKLLKKLGLNPILAENGLEAIEKVKKMDFDLILMDINMPIMSGFEASIELRKLNVNVPIIALTAFDKQEIIDQVLASGMNDIMVKPFEIDELYQLIVKMTTIE